MAGASAGSHGDPVAWLIDCGGEWQMVSLSRENADAAADENDAEVVPLYRSPTLTDAEREAIAWCVEMAATTATECDEKLAALRGLLERTK